MVSFSSIILAITAASGVLAAPREVLSPRDGTKPSAGVNNGFYYYFWTDGEGNVTYTNGPAGHYDVEWSGNKGNFVGGKGRNPGTDEPLTFSGDFSTNGNSYLSVYGQTTNPRAEYYIIESFGSYNPASSYKKLGTVTSDGSTYDIVQNTRILNVPIGEDATLHQYWSVRTSKRVSGTVTIANHFKAWADLKMKLGKHDFQIVAVESYYSSGSASITVS